MLNQFLFNPRSLFSLNMVDVSCSKYSVFHLLYSTSSFDRPVGQCQGLSVSINLIAGHFLGPGRGDWHLGSHRMSFLANKLFFLLNLCIVYRNYCYLITRVDFRRMP